MTPELTAPRDAEVLAETHISVLLTDGDLVYKRKKPVAFPFCDFSTREKREAACHHEVELNRRLAPDVYLGVADVTGADGTVCDHLVVMRRMPPDRRLAALVTAGEDVSEPLREVARRLAAFHAAAPTSPDIASAGTPAAVLGHWEDNVTAMRPFVGEILDPAAASDVENLARRYVDGRGRLFHQRMETGRIRDGHGDIQAEDIFCLDDGPRILDCIEFDDRLRHGDVLADIAFLAMDLERLGAATAAERFLADYGDFAGETYPASLAHHYIAYRAHVRAKVACLRHDQGDAPAAAAARSLLGLARAHLRRGRVPLVLVGGLPGTGKSTLARGLGDDQGWPVLRSDEVRKELAGVSPEASAAGSYGEGLYGPEMTAAVYDTLLDRARDALAGGEAVILDASWSDARRRRAAAAIAAAASSDLVALVCRAPAGVAADRLVRRAERGTDPSDATPEIAAAMAADADPWPEAVPIDTSGPRGEALAAGLEAVAGRVAPPDGHGG